MDLKLTLVCVALVLLAAQDMVLAEFLYNRILPKQEELQDLSLKCIPGRTTIKIQQQPVLQGPNASDESGDDDDGRRSHMRFATDDESCQVCVCSVEGKDEYCSKRPAMNVNECMRMAVLMDQFNKNEPYDHEKTLSYMIRRDLIWHNDEIPYDAKAKCKRSHSYYSNSLNANDTDIDLASDIESLINYDNKSICFYCVCTVSGDAAGCIPRSPWTCEYFRNLRETEAIRDKYKIMFHQDRPGYFRQLSYRLRRTMDDGVFDLIESVGDETADQKCVPFVSTYTDCTAENSCGGCDRCTCSAKGKWVCETVKECTQDELEEIKEDDLNRALDLLVYDIQNRDLGEAATYKTPYVPSPASSQVEKLLGAYTGSNIYQDDSDEMKREDDVLKFIIRGKRSVKEQNTSEEKDNGTVTFYHTIDAINEDTLKNTNISGTLKASQVDVIPQASRRSDLLSNSTSQSLQIEYAPPINNQHAADNRVDTPAIHDDKEDLLIHHKIHNIVGNQSQATRDKELSKLVVNELKGGAETIGDENAPVISNITFTSDNDTLTAMAFIAGNLLNKLWNMEKDASDNSLETEKIKQEKIDNLLQLFKEPLNLRQETFLRNALVELSTAMEKKDTENLSLCKNIEELKKAAGFSELSEKDFSKEKSKINDTIDVFQKQSSSMVGREDNITISNRKAATADALSKINNVLDLIKKYEHVQNNLSDFKSNSNNKNKSVRKSSDKKITQEENATLSEFGNILQSITALLLPNKSSKKINKGIKNNNMLSRDHDVKNKFKNLNLADMTLSAKDKIILDYLTHIQSSPTCLLNKAQKKLSLPNIEGDILLNLSEFFKIKSLSDLLKVVDSNKQKEKQIETLAMRSQITTPKSDISTTENNSVHVSTEKTNLYTTKKPNITKFEVTKEKLKLHLRTILEDLIELQNISGKASTRNNIDITQALPCIYNLLNVNVNTSDSINAEKQQKNTKVGKAEQINKVKEIFDKLKSELHTSKTRRTYVESRPRPKSVLVWERTIKNLGIKTKLHTRRNLEVEAAKPLEEVMKTIDNIDSSGSNTYKSIAYLAEVPPAEKLLLLKTLVVDTNKYINALGESKKSIESITELPIDQYKTIVEFIDNVNLNINLNEKVIKHLDEPLQTTYSPNQEAEPPKRFKVFKNAKENEGVTEKNSVIKLTRNQVINQLIKNRMMYYLRLKAATGENQHSFTIDLAKKILLYLEIGNDSLARQLYNIFITRNKSKSMTTSASQVLMPEKYDTVNQQKSSRRKANKVPLIDFVDPTVGNKGISWVNQDQLIKQLVSIKNMKI